jgi:hypothetical protein
LTLEVQCSYINEIIPPMAHIYILTSFSGKQNKKKTMVREIIEKIKARDGTLEAKKTEFIKPLLGCELATLPVIESLLLGHYFNDARLWKKLAANQNIPIKELVRIGNTLSGTPHKKTVWPIIEANISSRTIFYDDMVHIAEQAKHWKLHHEMLEKLEKQFPEKKLRFQEIRTQREKEWAQN